MSRLFLATSFSGHVNYDTGEVKANFRRSVEEALSALRAKEGLEVFCAVEHEGWIIGEQPPEVGVKKDLEEIDKSDILLAILPDGLISAGLQVEIGYALGLKKRVFIATQEGKDPGYFNDGLINLGLASYIKYESPESLAEQVSQRP